MGIANEFERQLNLHERELTAIGAKMVSAKSASTDTDTPLIHEPVSWEDVVKFMDNIGADSVITVEANGSYTRTYRMPTWLEMARNKPPTVTVVLENTLPEGKQDEIH